MSFYSRSVLYLALTTGVVGLTNLSLPVVDLGYEIHRASAFNNTGLYYNFSNIRYAQAPVDELRFSPPLPPLTNRSVIQSGTIGRICPQANADWMTTAYSFLGDYLTNPSFNASSFESSNSSSSATPFLADPRTTEDCLFLDVVVPNLIFENAGKGYGAPVLVWIYGGGYVTGDKTDSGNPAGLLQASYNTAFPRGVIYVAMNYRLGAFGFLSGPTFQSNGTANVGFLDQRLALEWVQKYIHLFGGDPDRVTVFGESAGAGSIMHHITAYGGSRGKPPFRQAILQSPGWSPITGNFQEEQAFQQFLSAMNATTIQEARKLPSDTVINANMQVVGQSPYGRFTFGPAVDGGFVPALPGKLLLDRSRSFNKDLRIMVGHNSDEGLLFTNPAVITQEDFETFVIGFFPQAAPIIIKNITQDLYPPMFNTSLYRNQIERTALLISEAIFTCNTNYLDKAFHNMTYSYLFSVAPGLHGQDVPYTYYNGGPANSNVANTTVALVLQDYITSFAVTGVPKREGDPEFQMYSNQSTILNLNITSISEILDPTANARCLFWQKGLYA